MADKPEGYEEEINEALWRPYLVFGIPPSWLWQWVLWAALAAYGSNLKWLIAGGVVHLLLFRATEADFEWPSVVHDFFKYPDDVDL
jgi:hypothetical protein